MPYKQAKTYIERLAKRLRQLLKFGEYGDWQINLKVLDGDHVGHAGKDEPLIGWQQAAVPLYQSDVVIAARQPLEVVRATTIHEHLHVVMAEVRRAVATMAGGDVEGPAWCAYDDAEERCVTRLERAFVELLGED